MKFRFSKELDQEIWEAYEHTSKRHEDWLESCKDFSGYCWVMFGDDKPEKIFIKGYMSDCPIEDHVAVFIMLNDDRFIPAVCFDFVRSNLDKSKFDMLKRTILNMKLLNR